jgi:hypothetical protein
VNPGFLARLVLVIKFMGTSRLVFVGLLKTKQNKFYINFLLDSTQKLIVVWLVTHYLMMTN